MRKRYLFLAIGLMLTIDGTPAQDLSLLGLAEAKDTFKEESAAPVLSSLGRLTLEGCLVRGNEADPYLLTEKDTGKTVTVVGSTDLEQHLGHLVRVRGARSTDDRYFHATQVELIKSSCVDDGNLGESVTADQQGDSEADRRTTRAIRYAVVNDSTLSFAAHNVKIITLNGVVTLRGEVMSADEKQALEMKAVRVAGAPNVKNELTIAAKDAAKEPAKQGES